jgi:molybdate/tungstate transport system ATP-binding protein
MIAVDNLHVRVGSFELRNIGFNIPTGAYAILMGRTGSGKTTLLEAICGLRPVTQGTIKLHHQDVTCWPPARRQIGFVPQEGALFPHLAVRQQIGFPLIVRNWAADKVRTRVEEVADLLGIAHLLERSCHGLSGGESQRIALGRALSFHPQILCLDEPLSALDHETRVEMCQVLEFVRRITGVTVLHITHHIAEAERLATVRLQMEGGSVLTSESVRQENPS